MEVLMDQFTEFLISTRPTLLYALVLKPHLITAHYATSATVEMRHCNEHLFQDLNIGLDLELSSIFIQVNRIGGPRMQLRDRLLTLIVSPPRQPQAIRSSYSGVSYKRNVPYLYMRKAYDILESHELELYNYLKLGTYVIPTDGILNRR